MIGPLLANIVSYSLIINKLRQERMRSISSVTIMTRSLLICTLFTLSWMPSVVVVDILQSEDKFGNMIVGKWFFYLNCLTDPILYAFSSKPITACLKRLKIAQTSQLSQLTISVRQSQFLNSLRRGSSSKKLKFGTKRSNSDTIELAPKLRSIKQGVCLQKTGSVNSFSSNTSLPSFIFSHNEVCHE